MLNTERQNFSMRLNLLFSWASLILHEISSQAFQVFDVLDDWVVIAVKRENTACQSAVKEITEAVRDSQMHIDSVILPGTDLQSHIETIEFFEGPPQYMQDVRPQMTLDHSRFTLESLQLLYKQLRAQQADTQLIDVQTFQNILLLDMQQSVLPNVWRYILYDAVDSLTFRLEAKPLSDSPDQANNMQLFRRKSVSTDNMDAQ